MKHSARLFFSLSILVSLPVHMASAKPFKLSFLDEPSILENTCQLLKDHGFEDDGVSDFRKLVEVNNKDGNRVDRTRFPASTNGYYRFSSADDLTSRLTCPFYQTPHTNRIEDATLTCFANACLLLRSAGVEAPRFEKNFDSNHICLLGGTKPVDYAELRTSNGMLCPAQWYKHLLNKPRSDAETRLILCLRAPRRLAEKNLENNHKIEKAFADHIHAMQRDGLAFPRKVNIGLACFVNLKHGYIGTDHIFICIPHQGRFICLEKNGLFGPYVRTEFESERDLGDYMSWSSLYGLTEPAIVTISLNERLIGIYRSDESGKVMKTYINGRDSKPDKTLNPPRLKRSENTPLRIAKWFRRLLERLTNEMSHIGS